MAPVLILLILGIAYGLWRAWAARRAAGRPAPRVVAPDDDSEFLRDLDRRTRRRDDDPLP